MSVSWFDFQDILCNTSTVKRPSVSKDAVGGEIPVYNEVITANCSRQGLSGSRQQWMGSIGIAVDYVCYFDTVLDVKAGDIDTDENGTTYIIQYAVDQGGTGEVFAVYEKKLQN